MSGDERKKHFLALFWRGNWNFYDPTKIEIWKISYYENKVKLNNEDKSKSNDNEIKEII